MSDREDWQGVAAAAARARGGAAARSLCYDARTRARRRRGNPKRRYAKKGDLCPSCRRPYPAGGTHCCWCQAPAESA